MINVEVIKSGNDNNLGIIRKFTKKVQGSGILPKVRSLRYSTRTLSYYKTKKNTLKNLKRKAEIMELIKMGKMADKSVFNAKKS
jgi:ribosomal protein S21